MGIDYSNGGTSWAVPAAGSCFPGAPGSQGLRSWYGGGCSGCLGGGGYGRADCWAVSLPSTDVANYHPTTLKNIAKNKKGAIIYVR